MPFKFAARAILEMGKELISSDEVALYELVKNSIDAKSQKTKLLVHVVMLASNFDDLKAKLSGFPNTADGATKGRLLVSQFLEDNALESQRAEFMARLMSARDTKTLIAALQAAYAELNWVEIQDVGSGMTLDELNDVYLTVGTRSRRKANLAGAQFLGDKGVGRLSAMRLGDQLLITTTVAGESHLNVLSIDWTLFGHEQERPVSEIDIRARTGLRKPNRADHGTIVRISSLSGDWSQKRFEEMLFGSIARMLDPFVSGRANQYLEVWHNELPLLIPSIPSQLLKAAHATLHAELNFKTGGLPVMTGEMNYQLKRKKQKISLRGPEVFSVTQEVIAQREKKGHAASVSRQIRPQALEDLGPFKFDLYWYNRPLLEAVEGLSSTARETKDRLANWSGGPMLYRHGFRVLPYGAPDDDWLELDKKAFGSKGFKLNRQQLIGHVSVNSSHAALSEQTNREGLIESQPTTALRALLMWIIQSEFRGFINKIDEDDKLHRSEVLAASQEFRQTEEKVKTALLELKATANPTNRSLMTKLNGQITQLSDQCAAIADKTEVSLKESKDEREKFMYLAGLGLLTESIFHELDRAVSHALREVKEALERNRTNSVLKNLETQLETLYKRVTAFDEMTTARRQTKEKFQALEVVTQILANHRGQFARHDIETDLIDVSGRGFEIRAVKGMFIQIVENLISNSVYWLKHQRPYESDLEPRIVIKLDSATRTISLTDNGPGVDAERAQVIFEPFVTMKPPKIGRGLGLYISREMAEYHGWTLEMAEAVDEVHPGRINTFILDLDPEQ